MKRAFCFGAMFVAVAVSPPWALAGGNSCGAGEAPDIIVGDLFDRGRYGSVDGVVGFSIGTESCNIGTCQANWLSGTPFHPVIAQNMFRLHDGRFEQIGMSWLKHGFATLNGNLCGSCIPSDGQHLGVNCSDPYWASLNGNQGNLGPRFEVNPQAGTHLHPFAFQGQTGNAAYKRMQVKNADMNPDNYPGAIYVIEGQYVAQDDAEAGNHMNNNSWRPVNILDIGNGEFDFALNAGPTVQQQPALFAWLAADPEVSLGWAQNEFVRASKATDLGNGWWHYEYAVQNVISDRAARSFTVPLPHGAQIANVGFHDIDHHSGEPYDTTDWEATITTGSGPNSITWQTQTHAENPNANALRWGTLFNFRFDADVAPVDNARGILGLFKPGAPAQYLIPVVAPDRCGDGFCEAPETESSCASDCAAMGIGAGRVPDGSEIPGTPLTLGLEGADLVLEWGSSCLLEDTDYGVYRGTLGEFASHEPMTCTTAGATSFALTPAPGDSYYLVVPNNGSNEGSYGVDSNGQPRGQGMDTCMVQSVEGCD